MFSKEHKNVIAAVKALECSELFIELNFKLYEYKYKNGNVVKTVPYYNPCISGQAIDPLCPLSNNLNKLNIAYKFKFLYTYAYIAFSFLLFNLTFWGYGIIIVTPTFFVCKGMAAIADGKHHSRAVITARKIQKPSAIIA